MLKFSGLLTLLLTMAFFSACNKADDTDTLDAAATDLYVEEALARVTETASVGFNGCYEFVFPVSLTFSDGTIITADSAEELRQALHRWKEANPGTRPHPELNFPVDLLDENGNLITVTDRAGLAALRDTCRRLHPDRPDRPNPGHHGNMDNHGCSCFHIVFPLTIAFPDASTVEVADRQELMVAIREWKVNHPDSAQRPTIVFPIHVELEDGTVMSVDDREALRALKESCGG